MNCFLMYLATMKISADGFDFLESIFNHGSGYMHRKCDH